MINHIDVRSVLRSSVCELYSNLLTRPTGAAVRTEIENQVDQLGDRALTVIDFTHVTHMDFSCADEIVAKLLLQYVTGETSRREVYFVFRGLGECHMDAIDAVLERHGLALVSELADGAKQLVGIIGGDERRAWEMISRLGAAEPADLVSETGMLADEAQKMLDSLWRKRLVIRQEAHYAAVGVTRRTES